MRHRSAKLLALLLCILLACSVLGGCAQAEPQKYSTSFFDVFDTVTTIIGYADSQETFDRVVGEARQQFVRYHQVFDGYNAYDGVHNLYYVNQNAASGPVPAEPELMTLLAWIRDLQPSLEGRVNVAMGAVLRLWHDAREAGVALPDEAALREAVGHVDMSQMILDEQAGTVYFADPELSLDLGAVAKGYTGDRVMERFRAAGVTSAIISLGGNVQALGRKPDGSLWQVAVQDPEGSGYAAVLSVADKAVITSGGYERYFEEDGKIYWHIIDPATGRPAENGLESVTIAADSGVLADGLSTALFVMGADKAAEYWRTNGGFDFILIDDGGTVTITEGLEDCFSLYGDWEDHELQVIRR